MKTLEQLANMAYTAYCDAVNWTSYYGYCDILPAFEWQAQQVKAAWVAAAKAVYDEMAKEIRLLEERIEDLENDLADERSVF